MPPPSQVLSEVLGVVDDTVRVVLVLEVRKACRVRGIVLLMCEVCGVRAVDVVDYGRSAI